MSRVLTIKFYSYNDNVKLSFYDIYSPLSRALEKKNLHLQAFS